MTTVLEFMLPMDQFVMTVYNEVRAEIRYYFLCLKWWFPSLREWTQDFQQLF